MKMNRKIIIGRGGVIVGLVFLFSSSVFAEEVKVSTYYPSPYGSYKNLDSSSDTHLATTSGNVGIGTAAPDGRLHVTNIGWGEQGGVDSSSFPMVGAGYGFVLDGGYTNGQYRHRFVKVDRINNLPLYLQQSGGLANSYVNLVRFGGYGSPYIDNVMEVFGNTVIDGNVGIGTTAPATGKKLDVNGDVNVTGTIKIVGGTPGPGKVLTSDADGNATWQVPTWG